MISKIKTFPRPYWFPVLIGLLLRVIQIQSPIVGIHSWRQADTAAMARHFALQNTPIWLPQIDWAGASLGYVECEFPLFPYLLGQLYKLFGIHEWIGRSLSILFSVFTIILVIRIGEYLLDPISGWWGGFFFAFLPLNVYYGRTLQAEALLLLLSAISLERLIKWKLNGSILNLFTSWSALCLAFLLKVLPFIWLGIPLLVLITQRSRFSHLTPLKELIKRLIIQCKSPYTFLFAISVLIVGAFWYFYAFKLGQSSGLSFGFWGEDSDRSSIKMLFNLSLWSNLLLRVIIRNLAIIGFPILVLGILKSYKINGAQILISGLLGVLICTAFALRASSIHEYYQFPFQLFACPLLGRGWLELTNIKYEKLVHIGSLTSSLSLMVLASLLILHFDYWAIEKNQTEIWLPLAKLIRKEVPSTDRIVSVTGSDPTLLNLARRQGWLTSAEQVSKINLKDWERKGATHIAGSLNWDQIHVPLSNSKTKNKIRKILCIKSLQTPCYKSENKTYLLPINQLTK